MNLQIKRSTVSLAVGAVNRFFTGVLANQLKNNYIVDIVDDNPEDDDDDGDDGDDVDRLKKRDLKRLAKRAPFLTPFSASLVRASAPIAPSLLSSGDTRNLLQQPQRADYSNEADDTIAKAMRETLVQAYNKNMTEFSTEAERENPGSNTLMLSPPVLPTAASEAQQQLSYKVVAPPREEDSQQVLKAAVAQGGLVSLDVNEDPSVDTTPNEAEDVPRQEPTRLLTGMGQDKGHHFALQNIFAIWKVDVDLKPRLEREFTLNPLRAPLFRRGREFVSRILGRRQINEARDSDDKISAPAANDNDLLYRSATLEIPYDLTPFTGLASRIRPEDLYVIDVLAGKEIVSAAVPLEGEEKAGLLRAEISVGKGVWGEGWGGGGVFGVGVRNWPPNEDGSSGGGDGGGDGNDDGSGNDDGDGSGGGSGGGGSGSDGPPVQPSDPSGANAKRISSGLAAVVATAIGALLLL